MKLSAVVARWRPIVMFSRHNLVRPSDRIEAAMASCAVLAVVLMIPISAAIGTVAYSDASSSAHSAQQSGQWVSATYVAVDTGAGPMGNITDPRATWAFDGRSMTGDVAASTDAAVGGRFELWIDQNGSATAEPVTGHQAAASGIATAVSVWLIVAALFTALWCGIHHALVRGRSRAWDHEWIQINEVPHHPLA